MGNIADMVLDGTLCQCCGVYIDDGDPPGYPRTCEACLDEDYGDDEYLFAERRGSEDHHEKRLDDRARARDLRLENRRIE